MFDSRTIVRLFQNVMLTDMHRYDVPEEAVRLGIESMAHVYMPKTSNLASERSLVADYNDVSHRCAYLHKYAPLHTAMVQDLFYEALYSDLDFYSRWVFSENFKICSIGGGPGSDIIGALSALHRAFSFFPASMTVIDYMFNWSYSFDSILRELGSGWYGPFGKALFDMNSRYLAANLLKSLTPEVMDALWEASLVTMVKFTSAASCQGITFMLKNIFEAMKPGAMCLYIDNDGGGYNEVFMDCALKCNFISVYGPVLHKNYSNEDIKVKNFGYVSCSKTTVTVHIIQKRYFVPYQSPYVGNQNHALLPSPFVESPPTPALFNPNYDFNNSIHQNDFMSPASHILPGPSNFESRQVVTTPCGSNKRQRRKNKPGCLPFNRFRHHLAVKVNKMKSRARSVFIKKVKKTNHPIFKL